MSNGYGYLSLGRTSQSKKSVSVDRLAYGEMGYGRSFMDEELPGRKHLVYTDKKTRRDSWFTAAIEGVSVAAYGMRRGSVGRLRSQILSRNSVGR